VGTTTPAFTGAEEEIQFRSKNSGKKRGGGKKTQTTILTQEGQKEKRLSKIQLIMLKKIRRRLDDASRNWKTFLTSGGVERKKNFVTLVRPSFKIQGKKGKGGAITL